jgi:LPXTG-site transpeptidase (sortase) family protein
MKGTRRAPMLRLERKTARQRDPGERVRALLLLGLGMAALCVDTARRCLVLSRKPHFGRKALSRLLLSLGTTLLVITLILAIYQPEPSRTFNEAILTARSSEQRSVPAAVPGPSSTPVSTAAITRLRIPTIGVDAAVVVKGLDGDGAMETPDDPWEVAWYDFSARPGTGSNVVFAGHVDHRDVGPAVFWDLEKLQPDSLIEVHLDDAVVYRYRVIAKDTVDVATAPVAQIVGPTPTDSVTLITCAGSFDQTTQEYDQRLVLRAERVRD